MKRRSPIRGRWRITEMEEWDADYFDMEADALVEFGANNLGEFHFGLVQGCMDYRMTTRDGKDGVEWSWDGADEGHPEHGRGWAVLQEDGMLTGRFFFHQGEESGFTAEKA